MEHEFKRLIHKADQPMSRKERLILTALAAVIGLGTVAVIVILDKLLGRH